MSQNYIALIAVIFGANIKSAGMGLLGVVIVHVLKLVRERDCEKPHSLHMVRQKGSYGNQV